MVGSDIVDDEARDDFHRMVDVGKTKVQLSMCNADGDSDGDVDRDGDDDGDGDFDEMVDAGEG